MHPLNPFICFDRVNIILRTRNVFLQYQKQMHPLHPLFRLRQHYTENYNADLCLLRNSGIIQSIMFTIIKKKIVWPTCSWKLLKFGQNIFIWQPG